ncbi:MAG: AbrB/MazE/SpoVT family DNA-binding domain-containing protein [Clostridia bacterium]|nr:AbrB/MazE/SpoVT family DNA-binding domain-containing protein [Clostridia bacterium]
MGLVYVDKLGRIVIPITVRRTLDINEGSALELELDKEKIIIHNADLRCKLCCSNIDNDLGIGLCQSCIKKVKNI